MARKKIPQKIRALLQKEISSECPFCNNTDVDCFEIHHIDGKNWNNESVNLLMLCPTCHTKIEKGGIDFIDVSLKKQDLMAKKGKIEFVSILINSGLCNWVANNTPNSFYLKKGNKTPHPVFSFTFINHLSQTIVLKTIEIKIKNLPSGLSGLGSEPIELKPIVCYSLRLKFGNRTNFFYLPNPIAIPSKQGFMFQTEVSIGYNVKEAYPFEDKNVLDFTFYFSNNIILETPPIFLNCKAINEPVAISILT